jgi:hypothetical protein
MYIYIKATLSPLWRKEMTIENILRRTALLITTILLMSIVISSAFAQEDDPAIFIIGEGSTYIGGSGWYAGYVIYGQSGTYKLNISATGSQRQFPIKNVKVIVLASNETANGGLKSLSINGTSIIGFKRGKPQYYVANGGPFQEPDYYGYNDTYVIPQLTFNEAHHPEHWIQLTVTVEFEPTATTKSKIMFLCYGTDAQGKSVETPFSGGTMFVIPDLASTLMGLTAFGGAYGLYYLRKRKIMKI